LFIKNLGAPDAIINYGVNVLPLLMTAINCTTSAIYTRSFPLRDKVQVYALALVFSVLLYNLYSALVLYWTLNNIFTLAKNILLKFKNAKNLYLCSVVCLLFYYRHISFVFPKQGFTKQAYCCRVCFRLRFYSVCSAGTVLLCKKIQSLPFGFIGMRKVQYPALQGVSNNTTLSNILGIETCAVLKISSPTTNFPRGNLISRCSVRGSSFVFVHYSFLLTGIVIPTDVIAYSVDGFSFLDSFTTPYPFILNCALQSADIFIFRALAV